MSTEWWCTTCKQAVGPEHSLNNYQHDLRLGDETGRYQTNFEKWTTPVYPEDIPALRAALDGEHRYSLSDFEIAELYRRFSSEEYCAQWLTVADGVAQEFVRWLT